MPRRILILVLAFLAGSANPVLATEVRPNSGLPGSACVGQAWPVPYTAPGPGISTSGFGPDAPGYYEIGRPSGAFVGTPPKGIMVVVHGGGWYQVGTAAVASMRPVADRWRERGWMTVNIDYRACAQSIPDVLWFYGRVRMARPSSVVCVTGSSAGAHLALIVAALRADLSCAVAMAGPTDFAALPTQTAYDYATGQLTGAGPTRLYNAAFAAFGLSPSPFLARSPIVYADRFAARLLLVSGERDVFVPREQNTALAAAVLEANPTAHVEVALLSGGDIPFIHDGVSADALVEFYAREEAFVADLVQ